MFKRSFSSKNGGGKSTKRSKRSFGEHAKHKKVQELRRPPIDVVSPVLTSAIVTIIIGQDQRLFAAHEDILSRSPFFSAACKGRFFESTKRISLPDEEPEVFSRILEYLYKGDYYPRLMRNKKSNVWTLEDVLEDSSMTLRSRDRMPVQPTIFHSGVGHSILRDTAVYCAAERYGLEELKGLSLRKQGLQSGIEVATVLRSARFAYDNTPDNDSRLRAHYLSLIIRTRRTFKRSGTMQMEMESGGKLFFDLFVAMCNHIDDIVDMNNSHTPRAS